MPPTAARASSASARYVRRPITTATSPSKSGRVSSRGMTISSPGPISDDENFAKTTGTARNVELRLLRVRAVVEPDRDELVRHDGVQQLDLVDRVRRAGRRAERGPRQGGGDEALRPGGAGVA